MLEAGKMGKALMSEEMLPLYDKYFTQQDVKDMIAFYKSRSGKNVRATTSNIKRYYAGYGDQIHARFPEKSTAEVERDESR